ncbi:RraA family protein [Roseomonas haemaphysalidis]|uniref:Putative 4-hydroxy-4-methyl-2-oxoglutarate aldolase n=1 Tax=Roseomonas haemaphysalidis TaxID=2768162 RepID=A0ABS3KJV5_9PROT|nr:RraA family protein [Roseomonas haemaphysalidis]MBO1077730.1 RraA family protein [Roseomonas haemaphysalidis]
MTPDAILDHLQQFDTPTVWNALTKLRGHSTEGLTLAPPVVSHPGLRMVGRAVTATMTSDRPAAMSQAEKDAIRFAYYRMAGQGAGPRIVAMQDVGERAGLGAIWGEVHAAIHLGLGCAGVITNGAVRDLDALGGFGVLAGSVCLGNGFTQIRSIGEPVEVLGLRVRPGDILHADRHGAMTIPPEYLAALPDAIERLLAQEKAMIDTARAPGFDAEALIAFWGSQR